MARNTALTGSSSSSRSSSGSKSESSASFFHAPAPALPFLLNSSDEEDGEGEDGGGEEEERAAAAWAARCCEAEAPNAVDAEAEAEWLARTATATAATTAAAAPAGGAGATAGRARKRKTMRKKRRVEDAQGGTAGTGAAQTNETTANTEEEEEQEDGDEEEDEEDDDAQGMLYIHNVMAYAQLNCPVNLDTACQAFGNAVYMPGIFESLRVDLRCRTNCIASINIFSNGKLTGTGANSVEEMRYAMKKVGRRLLLHPLTRCPVVFSHFRVKNILGTFAFSSLLSLHALAAERGLAADYEPERFPAVKVRVPVPAGVHRQQQSLGQRPGQGPAPDGGNAKDGKRGAAGSSQGMWGIQKQQQQQDGKQPQQQLHAAWSSSGGTSRNAGLSASSKDEVVTLHLFSTGNVTLFGGQSVESLQYALQCVLPFLYKCRVHTDQWREPSSLC